MGLYLPYNGNVWIFISLWIGLGIWKVHTTKKFKLSLFSKFLILGVLFLFTPFLYNKNIPFNLIYLRFIGIISITVLYLSLQQFTFNKKDYFYFYFIIIYATLLKSTAELIIQFFPNFLFNKNITIYLFNTLNHRNVQSTFLILGSLLSLFIFSNKKKYYSTFSFKDLILFFTTFIISINLILLQSKTALVALPISTALILYGKNNFNKKVILWLILTFSGLLIGNYLKENFSRNTRFAKRSAISNSNSFNVRFGIYKLSFDLWREKPFAGYGYGTFLSTFRNYYAKQKAKDPNIIHLGSKNVLHPHNEFLYWLVEGGIIAFAGLLIIAGSFIILIWKSKLRGPLVLIGCIFPILFHTQLEYPFYNSTIHLFLFCFFIFQIDKKYGEHKIYKHSFKFLPKSLAFVLPITSILFLLTVLQSGYIITKYENTGNIQLLQKALNPNSLKIKYDNYLLKAYLKKAKKNKNKQKLNNYISIVEKNIKHSPFIFLYYDLATAYEVLGEMDKASEIYNKGKYLYPDTNWKNK
ncbi:MAG: hypothetical protein CMB78_00865 [Euryarchaeota archaeon]|nr:hypothetical protein [Euryarchaeota archaeon]